MRTRALIISVLVAVNAFFIAFAIGFNSRHALLEEVPQADILK